MRADSPGHIGSIGWVRLLGAVKRLNLRFLIYTQHQRPFWRVEIHAHDIGQLAVELWVMAELEGAYPVRLQAVLLPDAMDRGRRQANFFGQTPHTPMGRGLRFAQGRADYCLFLRRRDSSWTPSARAVPQTIQAITRITSPPQTDRPLGNLEPVRQRMDALARCAAQDNPRPDRQRVCGALSSQPCLQLGSIRIADFHHPSLYAHAA